MLIDSDPIVYRCGFAAETPFYDLVVEHKTTDDVQHLHFEPADKQTAGARMGAWLENNPDWQVIDKHRSANPQALDNALKAVSEQIGSIQRACDAATGTACNVQLYLSGSGNYRERIATIRPYKGNRDATHKPVHYQAIRDYLVHEWKALIINGREADDEVSIVARRMRRFKQPFIIATIDKDLDQIPGRHYNYMKRVNYAVADDEAMAWFYVQCLAGDPTDNIGGCYKIGDVKAREVINDAIADAEFNSFDEDETEQLIWGRVVDTYTASQFLEFCPYKALDPGDAALETARLVKLQEYEGQLWNPPGIADELLA